MKKWKILALIFIFAVTVPASVMAKKSPKIREGKKVQFSYSLTVNGQEIDNSEKSGPIEYTHGDTSILAGLQKKIKGLRAGDEKTVVLSPEEGYGSINPQAFRQLPRDSFPENLELRVGIMLMLENNEGRKFPAIVAQLTEEAVVLNLNHPLAGQELHFDITIISVQ